MAFSITEAARINSADPANQQAQLGTEIRDIQQNAPYILTIAVTADATTPKATVMTEAFEVVDVIVQARATSGSGTLLVSKGASAVTNAIACATDTTIARAGTINDAYSTFSVGDTLNITANGATDFGLVTIIGKRV